MPRSLSCIALTVVLGISTTAYAETDSAKSVVNDTIDQVIAALVDQDLQGEQRRDTVTKIITERFSFHQMAQRIIATRWHETNEQQRERFVVLFEQILANSFWDRFSGYAGHPVRVVKSTEGPRFATVSTIITTESAEIPVDYRLLRNRRAKKWLAYDVVIENISLVQNYRMTYLTIMDDAGIDGLLAKMEQQAQR